MPGTLPNVWMPSSSKSAQPCIDEASARRMSCSLNKKQWNDMRVLALCTISLRLLMTGKHNGSRLGGSRDVPSASSRSRAGQANSHIAFVLRQCKAVQGSYELKVCPRSMERAAPRWRRGRLNRTPPDVISLALWHHM